MLTVALAPSAPRHLARGSPIIVTGPARHGLPSSMRARRGRQHSVSCIQRQDGTRGEVVPGVPEGFMLRRGTEADLPRIAGLVLAEKMNPLGLVPSRFTVACVASDGALAGIVQTVPMGSPEAAAATGAAAATPAPPGPTSSGRGESPPVKLQSLVVVPEHRGKGLGSALVRRQLAALPSGTAVWLTAVQRGVPFYQRLGFRQRALAEVPRELWLEVAAGTVVARLAVGQQLVVMSTRVAPSPSGERGS